MARQLEAIPGTVGLKFLESLAYLGSLAQLTLRSAYITFIGPFKGIRLHPERAINQAMQVGVGAIPIASLISFLFGLIMALQTGHELKKFGMISMVADAVLISILRELGPLLTSIVMIGRSGSAFAAEIGTKKVTEEVDALRTMAFDPVAFLVAPKFLAMVLMAPILTLWSDLMGVLGGSVFGVLAAGFTFTSYMQATLDAVVLKDLYTGLLKSVLFAMVITAVGCREGFNTGAGAEEVGRSTTAAVVMSIFLVVVTDMIFTALFYVVN